MVIVWFRQDLRLQDNPALWNAAKDGGEVIPLYIYNEKENLGGAQKVWLHHSLEDLQKRIPLILRRGDPYRILSDLQKETKSAIYTNRCYEPEAIKLEKRFDNIKTFKANLLLEPWEVSPKTSSYFKVFTPFWKESLKFIEPEKPLPEPTCKFFTKKIKSESLNDWDLLPQHPNWAKGILSYWKMGEKAAYERLESFVAKGLKNYAAERDFPAADSTSRLSPYLHFGQISPKQVWYRTHQLKGAEPFLRELGWREFSYHLLYHFPDLPDKVFNPRFEGFEWRRNQKLFEAWTQGLTGYPIVDAGMRQLWEIGWMHNRVRMIVASFLTKDLHIPWQEGEKWFWDTLVDADLANNAASWQWVAGCGADAAPYFRIFNPTLQAQKFDPEGEYIRQWVAELQDVDQRFIYEPWKGDVKGYPKPIVDHKKARDVALMKYKKSSS